MTRLMAVIDMGEVTSHTFRSLRAWRRAHRLSQERAAKMLGLSQSHYSKIERRTHALTGKRAKSVSKKTTVPLEMLVIAAA